MFSIKFLYILHYGAILLLFITYLRRFAECGREVNCGQLSGYPKAVTTRLLVLPPGSGDMLDSARWGPQFQVKGWGNCFMDPGTCSDVFWPFITGCHRAWSAALALPHLFPYNLFCAASEVACISFNNFFAITWTFYFPILSAHLFIGLIICTFIVIIAQALLGVKEYCLMHCFGCFVYGIRYPHILLLLYTHIALFCFDAQYCDFDLSILVLLDLAFLHHLLSH